MGLIAIDTSQMIPMIAERILARSNRLDASEIEDLRRVYVPNNQPPLVGEFLAHVPAGGVRPIRGRPRARSDAKVYCRRGEVLAHYHIAIEDETAKDQRSRPGRAVQDALVPVGGEP